MINAFLKYKVSNKSSYHLNQRDIQDAKRVLFALFTRYGDTIIDLVVIQEFVEQYPSKEYLVLCPKQMKPYFSELIPKIKCIGINKRNYLDMIKLNSYLKKWSPDIAFNPWSFGLESSFFLTYSKKYQFYKDFKKSEIRNHYAVIRKYLSLPEKIWRIEDLKMKLDYKRVLICPESTDNERSISTEQLEKIINSAMINFNNPTITIAALSSYYLRSNFNGFIFKKTEKSSTKFIKLVKDSDLVICADSAPLHIASVLKRNIVAVLNSTTPEMVLNSDSKLSLYKG
mgnify:CR=1 FL=1